MKNERQSIIFAWLLFSENYIVYFFKSAWMNSKENKELLYCSLSLL